MQSSFLLGKISCIIVAGGVNFSSRRGAIEVLTGYRKTKQVLSLLADSPYTSMVMHNEKILTCGGFQNVQKCLQLDNGIWKEHSTLTERRIEHAIVTTHRATFIFGGSCSRKTYEYLPKGSTTWIMGGTEIPGIGFAGGCAIAVKSGQEIWLIGGASSLNRIRSFNVNDHTFHEMATQLNEERIGHRCAFIPNTNKIMITGGGAFSNYLDSSEILDAEDGSITMASPMNFRRSGHGMGVITINGEDTLAVFGGYDGRTWLNSVELYNTQTEKWVLTVIKLNKPNDHFGFLTVKLSDAISAL